jgi:phosphate-selective porin OprO/OprP
LVAPARGQQAESPASTADLERRVRELEDIIRKMQAEKAQAPTAKPAALKMQADQPQAVLENPAAIPVTLQAQPDLSQTMPAGPGTETSSTEGSSDGSSSSDSGGGGSTRIGSAVAGWKDGFFLKSQDDRFVLRITGQIQADYRNFLTKEDAVDTDTFFLRRARFGIEAEMFKYYEFRFLPDYAQGKAVIQDAYLNIHYWDAFQVEAGKFKQPISYEQLIQDRFTPLVERSLIDQLVPARDEGVMIHGQKLLGDRLDYAVSVSNGEINGDVDTNEHKDVDGRVAVRPFFDTGLPAMFHYFQVGVSGGIGVEQEAMTPSVLKTPLTVPWFTFNSTAAANGVRWRLSPELVYFYSGLGFAAQWYREQQDIRSGPGPLYKFRQEVPFDGWYVMATYLLTGEERTAYTAITPLHNFNPCCPFACGGAWEAVARVSRLEVGEEVFLRGPLNLADPTKNSSGATEMTLGFNWYLNKWVRVQFNWEHAWFDDPVLLGTNPKANLTKQSDALDTRFQIIF